MADSKKYIGIYDTLEDVQDALDNGQLSKPYVAKTMDNGKIDYNSRSPIDYSQYWCTYYPIDAKIWVQTSNSYYNRTEYTKGDGKISKADFPNFYLAGGEYSTVEKFKYFQFDSTSVNTDFRQAWQYCSKLASFPMIDTSSGTNFREAWYGCSILTEFPQLDLSKGTDFYAAWKNCYKLTEFPAVDLSSGTNFEEAWMSCNSLTSFPALDFGKCTNFRYAWYECSSLTEFPLINTAKGTNFNAAWGYCTLLTSFPQLDLSSGTDFSSAWSGCKALTSLPQLDLSKGTAFYSTWSSCSSLTTLGGFGAIKENFDLSPCTKLTVDSLMNVINQAATVTGKTMTLGSTNLARLSDEQKAVATSKGWTLA